MQRVKRDPIRGWKNFRRKKKGFVGLYIFQKMCFVSRFLSNIIILQYKNIRGYIKPFRKNNPAGK